MKVQNMKKDLEFLLTGTYNGLSIGDSIEKMREMIKDPFHNMSDGETEIYPDNARTEFIFVKNELHMILLKSFKNGFLSPKFKKTIKRLNEKGIEWHINQELTFMKQLTICIDSSLVDSAFDIEYQDGAILKKAILSKKFD